MPEDLDEGVAASAAQAEAPSGDPEPAASAPDELVSWDAAQDRLDHERELEVPTRQGAVDDTYPRWIAIHVKSVIAHGCADLGVRPVAGPRTA